MREVESRVLDLLDGDATFINKYMYDYTIIIRSCNSRTSRVPDNGILLSVALYPLQHAGNPGVDSRLVWICATIPKTHNTNLSQSKYRISLKRSLVTMKLHLSFSVANKGPPESPWQESLPSSDAQIWNLKLEA